MNLGQKKEKEDTRAGLPCVSKIRILIGRYGSAWIYGMHRIFYLICAAAHCLSLWIKMKNVAIVYLCMRTRMNE